MGLLNFLGGDKKNTTTNTTNATQTTNNVSADAGSIVAGDGTSISIDSSEDYRYTDSRDMSVTDNSVDGRSYSSVTYDLAPDALSAALGLVNSTDARRSGDFQFAVGQTYNAALNFFDASASALRSSYESNAEQLADTNIRALDAVVEANRTDGQAVIDTVNKFGKYAALLIGAGIAFAAFRSA